MSMYYLFNDIFVEYSKLQFPKAIIICKVSGNEFFLNFVFTEMSHRDIFNIYKKHISTSCLS